MWITESENIPTNWQPHSKKSDLKFDHCQLFELIVKVNHSSLFFKELDKQITKNKGNIKSFFNKVAVAESLLELLQTKHKGQVKGNIRRIIDQQVYPKILLMKLL